jgi:hypothetical protein
MVTQFLLLTLCQAAPTNQAPSKSADEQEMFEMDPDATKESSLNGDSSDESSYDRLSAVVFAHPFTHNWFFRQPETEADGVRKSDAVNWPDSEIRNRKSGTGNPEPEIRNRKSGTGNPEPENRNRKPETGNPEPQQIQIVTFVRTQVFVIFFSNLTFFSEAFWAEIPTWVGEIRRKQFLTI